MKNSILALSLIFLAGCLQTRQGIKENATISSEEREKATAQAEALANEEQIRMLRGEIESLEHRLQEAQLAREQAETDRAESRLQLEERLKVYEETIGKLETQYLALAQKLETINTEKSAPVAKANPKTAAKAPSLYDSAETLFAQKKWREAIVEYQNYRDKNPKGRDYSDATYKIGVSFQELGMKDEAKAFYTEVVQKFGKTKTADKAKYRLKNLK